ncbi:hypothetical protein BDF22DRAFT_724893 [Syncephalis plumigaleata]|nr:hypothetical protein BDF22DRAFT_724893 [Syncephalis plumigaleata]
MNTEQGVHQWLQLIKQYGIGFVKDVPPNAFDTEKLALRISHIRHTHYGRWFLGITADMAHNDTAYTTLSLQLHTDNTYFTDPAGLQMFHILRPADKGGESLFLDGFNAARILYEKDPHAYRVLSTTRTNAMACGDNRFNIQPAHAYPLLNHLPTTINGVIESVADTSQSSIDRLFQVRYNNDDRAPLCLDVHETREYYQTLRVWQSIVRDPANILEIALPPGLVVCFDNWRVLHGRNAFVGRRQVCGCYHGADDWHSRLRALSERNNSIDNNIH